MEPGAIAMMIFGMVLLWGGTALCIGIATKKRFD